MTEGVFCRVGTDGKVGLAVSSGRLSVGPEDDAVNAGRLKETELTGNETSEIELIAKEKIVGKLKETELPEREEIELIVRESVGKLPLGSRVVLSDRGGTDTESSEAEVCKFNEVPLNSILEKLVVNTLAKSLVGIPPGVIELAVVRPGAVRLTETEGTDKLPVKISEDCEGRSGDRLVGSPPEGSETLPVYSVDTTGPEGSEMLPVDKVDTTEPIPDVPSDEIPDRLVRSVVGAATKVASGMRLDALKVPVVYTVTVYGVYEVIVTEPSQTGRHQSVPKRVLQTK